MAPMKLDSRRVFVLVLAVLLTFVSTRALPLPIAERDFLLEFMAESGQLLFPEGWDLLHADQACDAEWRGIECIELPSASRITSIELEKWNYAGTLPSSVRDLTYLETLSLVDMNIRGPVPATIGLLEYLSVLNLQSNRFNGSVPASVWNLDLLSLNLAQNEFTGQLPNFQLTMASVLEVNLAQNNFTGTIPSSVSNLLTVSILELASNELSGEIPAEVFELQNLFQLDLSDNQLTGSIPALSDCPGLYIVDLSNNNLEGDFPSLAGAPNLTSINFGLNQLSGSLPAEITTMPQLSDFIVRENAFTGGLPPGFTSMAGLSFWDSSFNYLDGVIPLDINFMTDLSHFAIAYNNFDSGIPDSICSLKNMTYINLSNNRFSGSLPDCLGNLKNLTSFYADFNQISGTIPPSMGFLAELTHLALSGNQLTGAVPKTLGNATSLEFLLLGSNKLNSDVPFEISELANLISLDLSSNLLFGPFPYGIGRILKLRYLQIDNNNLSCPLGSLNNIPLESCDASNNWLCGGEQSPSIYSPSCEAYFPNACKLTSCRSPYAATPANSLEAGGPDGSLIRLSPQSPSFELHTYDPRIKKTSVLKVDLISLNENLILASFSSPASLFPSIADRSGSTQVLNEILASDLQWSLSYLPISTPNNPSASQWAYSTNASRISSTITVTVTYLPAADSIYVYNESLALDNGSFKVSISAQHWNLITRPSLSQTWATSAVFQISCSGDDSAIQVSDPYGTGPIFPIRMMPSDMRGSILAIQNGQFGDPGTVSPLVALVYNTSQDQAAAVSSAASFKMASYFVMPSTANVTFSYDLAFQLVRTPVPPPKPQLLGSTAGFAILMIVIILIVAFVIFSTIMWRFPKLRRRILPCLGRASDPVEYL